MNMDTVRRLMKHGHSAAKAFEIELDARRGDAHAQQWVALVEKHAND